VSSTLTREREDTRAGTPADQDGTERDRLISESLQTSQRRSEGVKLRRGLTFLGMTLVLPGSAQLAAGNRRVGRTALRVWASLWVLALVVGLLVLVWHSAVITVLTKPATLVVLQVLLVVLGIAWALLFLDAWRISNPPDLARRHRLGFALLSLGLAFTVAAGLVASANVVSAQRQLVSSVFAGGGDKVAKDGRINILLMGGDAGADRTGLRPDSMTVASVDQVTGRTVLISLPRNMERAPFPASSPLHKKFPDGYRCPDHSCMLNAVYTYAMEHKDLYPGVKNPGAQATKEAVEGVTGLTINYWALIDLKGFENLVDAVGGITMDVYRRVPIGGGHAKLYGWVEAGKDRHLDGREALWFARSRSDSSDYDRMVRQKCVMNAMLNQLDPVTVLTKFNGIASASKEIVATDIPASQISSMLDLAQKAKSKPVGSIAIVPPLMKYSSNPDFGKIRAAIDDQIAKSEAKDAPKPSASASAPAPSGDGSASAKPKKASSSSSTDPGKAGADTSNLSKVCSA
jgi:polyisoprenyl-teichoic acid--peptidoglycan teichoic acid transferase